MSIPVSSIAGVKAYIYNGLLARAELAAPVLVAYDDPGPYLPDDIVAVTDASGEYAVMQMVGGGGAGWINEHYGLEVVVDVYRGGDTPQIVFERCASLAAVVLDFLRTDPSCGGLVNIVAKPGRFGFESGWEPERLGRLCRFTVAVDVQNRI